MKLQEWLKKVIEEIEPQGFKVNFGNSTELFWSNALAGEAGEYANLCKKSFRGDQVDFERKKEELADVAGHAYLIANLYGINLDEEVKKKMKQVIDEEGWQISL